jgi:glycosyltransferase involved in cell wall biosynthesis
MLISVVLCTYNPVDAVLSRALDAILSQDLDQAEWEFVVVDNNSSPPVSARPSVTDRGLRVVTEPKQGLSAARECGVRNSRGAILVFVDDDNLIASDYLRCVASAFEDSRIGVVSGAVDPEYERQPPAWFSDFENVLAIRRPPSDATFLTNIPAYNEYFPIGAGMSIRREVIESYYQSLADGGAYVPGRVGTALSSGEDLDLDFFAISQGYLIGTVGALKLRHVIPAARTTPSYISRLAIASTRSAAEVNAKWSNALGVDVFDFFRSSRRKNQIKCALAALLSWSPGFRVRYHFFKTLSEVTRGTR